MPKLRQQSRMCRWCGQAFCLGKRREFLNYCNFHHYWFDVVDKEDAQRRYRDELQSRASTINLCLAGGDGLLRSTEARVYELMPPVD